MNTIETSHDLARALIAEDARYREVVHDEVFIAFPQARGLFSNARATRHADLVPALTWALTNPPALVDEAVAELGRDHRRHGFPTSLYDVFAAALIKGLRIFNLSFMLREHTAARIRQLCTIMKEAADAADLAGVPPAHSARVMEVKRPNRNTAIVRVETPFPIDFAPGQALPVTTTYLPGTWRLLTPAVLADESGQLIFHVYNAGDASTMLVRARPGDTWTLGNPRGEFPASDPSLPRAPQEVVIAYGTGWAAVRAFLLAKVNQPKSRDSASVICHASSPGAHYDLQFQVNLRKLLPNVQFRYTVENSTDPHIFGAAPVSAEIHATTLALAEVTDNPARLVLEELLANPTAYDRCVLVGDANQVLEGAGMLNIGLARAGIVDCVIEPHPWDSGALTRELKYRQGFSSLNN
ncbi:MAG: FAD-binding oxidoreductase [Corynebacterium sp.]|nr:FAD-binding oxidoreductase [Corynebacterium sp.]